MCSIDGADLGTNSDVLVSFPVRCRNVCGTFVEHLLLYCFDITSNLTSIYYKNKHTHTVYGTFCFVIILQEACKRHDKISPASLTPIVFSRGIYCAYAHWHCLFGLPCKNLLATRAGAQTARVVNVQGISLGTIFKCKSIQYIRIYTGNIQICCQKNHIDVLVRSPDPDSIE
jgi:hypothetical protein